MTNLEAFAKGGVSSLSISGRGSGLTLSEIKGFAGRGTLGVGMASAIATRLAEGGQKDLQKAILEQPASNITSEKDRATGYRQTPGQSPGFGM